MGTLPLHLGFSFSILGCTLLTSVKPGKAPSAASIARHRLPAWPLASRAKVVTRGASLKFSGLFTLFPSTECNCQSGAHCLFCSELRYLSIWSGSTLQMFSGKRSRFLLRGGAGLSDDLDDLDDEEFFPLPGDLDGDLFLLPGDLEVDGELFLSRCGG